MAANEIQWVGEADAVFADRWPGRREYCVNGYPLTLYLPEGAGEAEIDHALKWHCEHRFGPGRLQEAEGGGLLWVAEGD